MLSMGWIGLYQSCCAAVEMKVGTTHAVAVAGW
jgi:hypothetical protein